MEYESAPNEEQASRPGKPYFAVLMSGLITSAVTLAGVYWLGKHTTDFHIMGWYANYVIPAGAMIVGFAAASGYAIASWVSGTRISKGLLLAVLLLQTGAYITAEYVEYRDVMDGLKQIGLKPGAEPSFLQYYDFKARSFAWHDKGVNKRPGEALGGWGYVFVLLGAAGFILSGLIAPAVLYAVPYCDRCQRYMKKKLVGVLPASVPAKKFAKKDQAAQKDYAKKHEQAAANAEDAITRLRAAVAQGQADPVKRELLAAGNVKTNQNLPRRVQVSLIWCKACQEGRIVTELATGHGKTLQVVKLAEDPASAAFVTRMLDENAPPSDAGQSAAEPDRGGPSA